MMSFEVSVKLLIATILNLYIDTFKPSKLQICQNWDFYIIGMVVFFVATV